MQLALNSGELLAEEKFLLLLRKTFIDSGSDLLGDLGDRCLLDEYLSCKLQTGFCIWGTKDSWKGKIASVL